MEMIIEYIEQSENQLGCVVTTRIFSPIVPGSESGGVRAAAGRLDLELLDAAERLEAETVCAAVGVPHELEEALRLFAETRTKHDAVRAAISQAGEKLKQALHKIRNSVRTEENLRTQEKLRVAAKP